MKSLLAILTTAAVLVFQSPFCWCGDCEDPAAASQAHACCSDAADPASPADETGDSCPVCEYAAARMFDSLNKATLAPAPLVHELPAPAPATLAIPVASPELASTTRPGTVAGTPPPLAPGALRPFFGVYLI